MVILIVGSFSSLFAFVLCIGQLIVKNKKSKNYLLAAIYLCLAMLLMFFVCLFEKVYLSYPHLYRTHTPFTFSLGPLLYLFFKSSLDDDFKFGRAHLWHFLPTALALVVMIPFFAQSREEKLLAITELFFKFNPSFIDYFAFLSNLVILAYMVALAVQFAPLWRLKNLRADAHARLFLSLLVIAQTTAVLSLLIVFFKNLMWLQVSMYCISVLLLFSYLIGQRYPEFLLSVQELIEKEKYQRSVIVGLDLGAIENKLKHLMQDEQLFKQDDLSLADLAKALAISKHQLSEYLNTQLNLSFFHYINSLRIDEACKWLVEDPEMPILDVAFSVGFNSKSSFNSAFNRRLGMTPRQYRKQQSKV